MPLAERKQLQEAGLRTQQERQTTVLANLSLPWTNGEPVQTILTRIDAHGRTLYAGDISDTYFAGTSLTPEQKRQAEEAYQRTLRAEKDMPFSTRSDDCLTLQGNPSIRVNLLGRNLKRGAIYDYVLETTMKDGVRGLLHLGACTAEDRNRFERGLTRIGYRSNRAKVKQIH